MSDDEELLEMALTGLGIQRDAILAQVALLQEHLNGGPKRRGRPAGYTMPMKTRIKMAASQRKRWAQKRQATRKA